MSNLLDFCAQYGIMYMKGEGRETSRPGRAKEAVREMGEYGCAPLMGWGDLPLRKITR